ncbi:response regulator transcription factor [Aurantivibrio plasticivorans]
MDLKKKVLVIDDDKITHKVISKALLDKFDVYSAFDGKAGILEASQESPQVILLDVEMPGMNGYEVCDALKNQASTKDIPVVFLSSRSSLRERMLGYEVGADDYLTKPASAEIIQAKLKKLTERVELQTELSTKAKSAEQTALQAIAGSSELGKAIRFVESSFSLTSYSELASKLFELLEGLGLKCCLLFKTDAGDECFTQGRGVASPLEQDLMKMLHSEQRFYDFGCRTQVNYPSVALLVKNMPLDNRENYGRIKDLIPFVLAASDEKVRILNTEHALREQAANLSRSVDAVKTTLKEITSNMQGNQEAVTQVVRDMLDKLEMALPKMGLEDDQESYIIQSVDTAFASAAALIDQNTGLKASLEGVIRLLSYLTDEQNQILETAIHTTPSQTDDGASLSDIELF